LVENGDIISLDVPNRSLELEVDADELGRRVAAQTETASFAHADRGWQRLYIDHVEQADTGADLDFLVGSSGSHVSRESH
jgi:dihydroxy-acid dehydratase